VCAEFPGWWDEHCIGFGWVGVACGSGAV
jgi:hypothetical protein